MARIRVHVLNFHGLTSHIELLLEDLSVNPPTYYSIDRWSEPRSRWGQAVKVFLEWASSSYNFEIEADPKQIIDEWCHYYQNTEENASVFGENCAVATQRFLTHFANIPAPKKSNLSWNHVACGVIWWPNIIPCPILLPGRVMDNVKYYTKKSSVLLTFITDLPEQSNNPYFNAASDDLNQKKSSENDTHRVQIKLNQLHEFYNCLSELNEKAHHLRAHGHIHAAETTDQLIKNIQACAFEYLDKAENTAFQTFKSQCLQHINNAKPVLAAHRGRMRHCIINLTLALSGVGVLYAWIMGTNKTLNGHFTFFKKTNSIQKVDKLANALTKLEKIEQASTLTPLRLSVT